MLYGRWLRVCWIIRLGRLLMWMVGFICGLCRVGGQQKASKAALLKLSLVEYGYMKYRVFLEPDEDGIFVANCPSLPGCISQGRTRSEATLNIREAIEGYLESLNKHGEPVPPSILEEVIEVAG